MAASKTPSVSGAVEAPETLMEQIDTALDEYQSMEQCSWCFLYKQAMEMKQKSKKMTCKECQSIQQQLYRNLGSYEDAVSGMTPEEQSEFFQEAGKTVELNGGGRWKCLKAILVEKKAKVIEREQSASVGGDYVPMSVWVTRGWSEEDVKSFDDVDELPNGTKLYRCAVKSKVALERKRQVEESLLERERECKKRKIPKAKAKAGAAPPEAKEQDVWMVASDSEDERTARRGTAQEKEAKAAAAKAAKQERQAEVKLEKGVSAAVILAGKAMTTLSSQANSLSLALKTIEKEGEGNFDKELTKSLREACSQISTWKDQATEVLHLAKKDRTAIKPDSVTFDAKGLQSAVKASAPFLGQYKDVMKDIRAKRALEKEKARQEKKATATEKGKGEKDTAKKSKAKK